jgi:SAM-dependent methyltransferase
VVVVVGVGKELVETSGVVLDAGCGTGENALHVASLGWSVLGVDVAEMALAIAREKADDRGIEVEFAAADAFRLEGFGPGSDEIPRRRRIGWGSRRSNGSRLRDWSPGERSTPALITHPEARDLEAG